MWEQIRTNKRFSAILVSSLAFLALITGCQEEGYKSFASSSPKKTQRTWIGPEYWANPLQDWQLNNGRIECTQSGGDRNVFLLTHELTSKSGTLNMSVDLGLLIGKNEELNDGWVGYKLGVRGEFNDYRDNAVRGDGLKAGISTDGKLFIGKILPEAAREGYRLASEIRTGLVCWKKYWR